MRIGHRAPLILAILLLVQQARGANLESAPIPVTQMDQPMQGSPSTSTGRAMFFINPAELRDELAVHELLPWLYAGAQLEGYSSYEKHGGPANTDTYLDSISGALRWVRDRPLRRQL